MERRRFLECLGVACASGLTGGYGRPPLALAADGAGTDPTLQEALVSTTAPATVVDGWARAVCDLCGLGDPVFLGTSGGTVVAAKGIAQSPVGFGRLCPRAAALFRGDPTRRLLTPLVRRDPNTKGTAAGLEPATWGDALAVIGPRLAETRTRLGDAGVAFFASDGETNEDAYLLSRIARTVFRTDNVDTMARLDALHAYGACLDAFGLPGNPSALEDIDAADLIVLFGADCAESHPGVYYRVHDARRSGRTKVVVIDSRKTLAVGAADLHLRAEPGRELDVWNAVSGRLAVLGARSGAGGDREDVSTRRRLDRGFTAVDGVSPEEIDSFAAWWRDARGVMTLVSPAMLSGPRGSALARDVAQQHRGTGRWGTPGNGVFFLPRGANASGVLLAGLAPGRFPMARSLTNPLDRDVVGGAWGVDPTALPERSGLPAPAWPAAIASGEIGALVLLRTNPAVEMPAAPKWRAAMKEAFVVSVASHAATETEAFADVVLPVALVAGESRGTMTSLGRQVQLLELAVEPPADVRTMGRVLVDLAETQESGAAQTDTLRLFAEDPHRVGDELRALSVGTVMDVSGVTPDRLRTELGPTWPCTSPLDPGLHRLEPSSGTRPRFDGEGNELPPFVLRETSAPEALASAAGGASRSFVPSPGVPARTPEWPFLLVGGPAREHFRSRVRTGNTPDLHYDAPVARLEMHPLDGSRLGIGDGEWVTVASPHGELTTRIWLVDRVSPGNLFLPEHYGFRSDVQGGSDGMKEPEACFHLVTSDAFDRTTGTPAGNLVAVNVARARRKDMRGRGLED
ncbi:MAG: molybdopterin oxidoreductase family protein [Candidatus Eisenbacteria bacterium]